MRDLDKNSNFALYFLFSEAVAFKQDELKERIESISEKEVSITPIVGLDGEEKHLYVRMNVDGENFDLVGIEAPLPKDIISYTIECAYGKAEELQEMREHGFHILVFYKGENESQQKIFDIYKKLAYGFSSQGLLGIVNPYSWNVIGANLITEMVEDEELKAFSETPAMMIWRNFIKMPYEEGIWFVTKGNNLFGVHEYAYFGTFEEVQCVYNTFENIFSYVYEQEGVITAGDTMQIGEEEFIKFITINEAPEEIREHLQGETVGTLVIKRISADEINK